MQPTTETATASTKTQLAADLLAEANIVPSRHGRGRPRIETPHPVDVHVGTRIRLRRNMLGMSQETLGEAVGVTFQQIQKYERGANRISSSRLWQFSQVLETPVSYFFEGIDEDDRGLTLEELSPATIKAAQDLQRLPQRTRAAFTSVIRAALPEAQEAA